MLYNLDGDDSDLQSVILDNKKYFVGEIKNFEEIKKMVFNISSEVDLKSQWLSIARSILKPYNDVNSLSIENEEQLVEFIRFITVQIENETNK